MVSLVNGEILAIAARLREVLSPKHIYLYGSFAKGNARPDSDYDFYVVVSDDAENLLELSKTAYAAIRDLKRRPADIIIKHESVFRERTKHNTIEQTVLQEGVEL